MYNPERPVCTILEELIDCSLNVGSDMLYQGRADGQSSEFIILSRAMRLMPYILVRADVNLPDVRSRVEHHQDGHRRQQSSPRQSSSRWSSTATVYTITVIYNNSLLLPQRPSTKTVIYHNNHQHNGHQPNIYPPR